MLRDCLSKVLVVAVASATLAGCYRTDAPPAPKDERPTAAPSSPSAAPSSQGPATSDETPKSPTAQAAPHPSVVRVLDALRKARAELRASARATPHPTGMPEILHDDRAASVVAAIGEARKGAPLFVAADGSLRKGAQEVIELVEDVASHGLDPKAYRLEDLAKARDALAKRKKALETALKAVHEPLRGWLLGDEGTWLDDESASDEVEAKLARAGLTDERLSDVQAAVQAARKAADLRAQVAEAARQLDVLLIRAVARYALDFKYLVVAHPFKAMRHPERGWSRFRKKLVADVVDLDPASAADAMRKWWPHNPLYDKLRKGFAFYRKLAAEDHQPKLDPEVLRKGDRGNAVRKLQERLAQEGYYRGDVTGVFDDATAEAVRAYQETHQLDVDGVVGGGTRRSMNVPYARRVAQVALGLQRWRESDARWEDGVYVRVNIPQFEVELWRGPELLRRHRVVVGSNSWEVNTSRGTAGKLNRTALFSAEMKSVVIDPKWRVPRRIIDTELDAKLAEDPEYFIKHNYEVEVRPDGTELVVQGPGPGNALGLVKLLFPNEHSIYMHDTPQKKYFEKRIRAFSHGCIRVQNAVDFARYILVELDGRLTAKEFDKLVARRKEKGVTLHHPIPVHIEYNTVSVDDEGRVRFFIDIYEYDKAFFDGKVPLQQPGRTIARP